MEKAILIGIRLPKTKLVEVRNSLVELSSLAETAGAWAEDKIIQNRQKIDPAYFIGTGKAAEIKDIIAQKNIRTVIFDDDLKPVQQKNLEELIEAKIVDRTRLILDIFAQRARTAEGKLQVERAQLAYYLPRLSKKGISLDGQVGGIGTRKGPGERKLEIEQRRIRDNIVQLDREIESIRKRRELTSRKRTESGIPVIAIVGYTNAGKSTLLNKLSSHNPVYADNKLFATLDPTTRQVNLPGGRLALFSDTVGFINKLPHTLIAAFRATMEEITRANCIVHLIDVSHPDYQKQTNVVLNVLKELNAGNVPLISVYNKSDLLRMSERTKLKKKQYNLVSAKTGEGIDKLLELIERTVNPKLYTHEIIIPYKESSHISKIFQMSVVKKQNYTNKGIKLKFESTPEHWEKIRALLNQL